MTGQLGQKIKLKIATLGSNGDGVGEYAGRKVYVPYLLPQDEAEVEITSVNSNFARAKSLNIINENGTIRGKPICRHFGNCGGCSLQHLSESFYREFKLGIVKKSISRAGFNPDIKINFTQVPLFSRRRANLKIKNGKVGFFAPESNNLVKLEECKILSEGIFSLIKPLENLISELRLEIEQVQVTELYNGLDIIFFSKSFLPAIPEKFFQENKIIRLIWKAADSGKIIYQKQNPLKKQGGVEVELPEEYFLQATDEAEDIIIKIVNLAAEKHQKILDLFAGIGTYTFAFKQGKKIHAVEISRQMVDKILETAKRNNLSGISGEVANLDKNPTVAKKINEYDFVIINPPRTGALNQVKEIAKSTVKNIVMVSCNPDTFARDTKILHAAGFNLQEIYAIDQFKFTHHLEIVAVLSR